jgi:mono/diheme cytochrome c family protein
MARPPLRAAAALAVAATIGIALAIPAAAQFEANRRPDRPVVVLPDEPVRSVILKNCAQCHGIDEYGYYAMDRVHWDQLIERMKTAKSGIVAGTNISDQDKEVLLDWLVGNYGPDTEPFFREYVPRPMTEADYLSAAQGNAALEAHCTECHGLDDFAGVRLDVTGWRTRLVNEIARGSTLLIQDADPLVEWLARTRGAASVE